MLVSRPQNERRAAASASSGVAGSSRASATRPVTAVGGPNVAMPGRAVGAVGSPLRERQQGSDARFNRQVTGTQLSLDYLGRAGEQLRELRVVLAEQVARPRVDTSPIQQRIRQFDAIWRARAQRTGGTLDAQLNFNPNGGARQVFTVRGLTMEAMRQGTSETLTFAALGRSLPAGSVAIEPGLADEEIVRRFDRALAPSGIRARLEAGELTFSVPEVSWPAVRDTLAIKGDGRRFPTGQFSQVRVLGRESVIRPATWSVDDPLVTQRTLRQVATAQVLMHGTRQKASTVLVQLAKDLQLAYGAAGPLAEAEHSLRFAQSFALTTGNADFRTLAAITPALSGVDRKRVSTLLGFD